MNQHSCKISKKLEEIASFFVSEKEGPVVMNTLYHDIQCWTSGCKLSPKSLSRKIYKMNQDDTQKSTIKPMDYILYEQNIKKYQKQKQVVFSPLPPPSFPLPLHTHSPEAFSDRTSVKPISMTCCSSSWLIFSSPKALGSTTKKGSARCYVFGEGAVWSGWSYK